MAMEINLKGGTGNNKPAGVTSDNRLQVASRTETEELHETDLGNSYNLNSGELNFTGTTESGMLYIKNTGADPIIVPAFIWLLGTTNGTFGEWRLRVYRNPTTGTLISDASALTPINKNFGSNKLLSDQATIYKASGYGKTVTDGDVAIFTMVSSSGRFVVSVAVELPTGGSLAMTVEAPGSTTDADVAVAIAPYVKTVDD